MAGILAVVEADSTAVAIVLVVVARVVVEMVVGLVDTAL